MSGPDNQHIAILSSGLVDAARQAGEARGLYGAKAGEILRRVDPDFKAANYGVESVRDFIARYVAELHVIGRSGSDLIYGLKDWPPRESSAVAPVRSDQGQIWRIWVSPSSRISIVIAKDGSNVRSTLEGPVGSDEIEIPPASPELHLSIARGFLEEKAGELGPTQSATLASLLRTPGPSWWLGWTQAIRSLSRELNARWMSYRQAAFERLLENKMKELGAGEEAAKRALVTIVTARELRHRERILTARTPTDVARTPPQSSPPLNLLHPRVQAHVSDLVNDLTSKMGESELRKISLLLSLMIDSVIDEQRR